MNVYIISGASGDIGSAIANALAVPGNALCLLAHENIEALLAIAEQCTKRQVPCLTLQGDLASETFATTVAERTVSEFGHIDAFIHAAGIAHIGLLSDLTLSDWYRLIDSNLSSAFLCTKAILPHMIRRQNGRILYLSSVWGARGASCEAAYSATKGALDSMTKALAKEMAPSGIAVNALAPGLVSTKMNACFTAEELAAICEDIPAGRVTTPAEVAQTVLLLLQAPIYLTGQIIGLNGGWF